MFYPKETQTDPTMIEYIVMQTEDPYIFSQGTQMDHATAYTVVQTDVEEDVQVYCIIQEVVEAAVKTEPTETQDGVTQTDETPFYTPLVREAIVRKLQNQILMVQQKQT